MDDSIGCRAGFQDYCDDLRALTLSTSAANHNLISPLHSGITSRGLLLLLEITLRVVILGFFFTIQYCWENTI